MEPGINVLMAVGDGAILAGPGWATPPTLDGGDWTLRFDQPATPTRGDAEREELTGFMRDQ
jgi:hypothetical protein